jgi:hypothetical protein
MPAPYQHKPDISVKLSPRITRSTSLLIRQVCRRRDMFEADVLRFCLEAIAPEAARRGVSWLIRQIPHFDSLGRETYSSMLTVRTSKKVKAALDKMTARQRYTEVEILRYCYLAVLPIALAKGFSPIMAMRERNLSR